MKNSLFASIAEKFAKMPIPIEITKGSALKMKIIHLIARCVMDVHDLV